MFGSWRLDPDADVQHSTHGLQGRVQALTAGGNGFLQAKTVYQHDHMHHLPSGIYVFLQVRLGATSLASCMHVCTNAVRPMPQLRLLPERGPGLLLLLCRAAYPCALQRVRMEPHEKR